MSKKLQLFDKCSKLGIKTNKKMTISELEKIINSHIPRKIDIIFNLEEYLNNISKYIKNILSEPRKNKITYDILDTEIVKQYKINSLKVKQYEMKIGKIWQEVLGTYDGYINLDSVTENKYGLDIMSEKYKIIIELKNRSNTCNNSSKKSEYNKLADFKIDNPEFRCIFAYINDDTYEKTFSENYFKKKIHNGVEIELHSGYNFIKFILKDNTNKILEHIKDNINKYSNLYFNQS